MARTPFKMKGSAFYGKSPLKQISLGPKSTIKDELIRGGKQFISSAKGEWKGFKVPSVSSKIVKTASTLGKFARFATKTTGACLVAEGLYQAYKSGKKHSGGKVRKGQKSFMAESKLKTKSIWDK